MEALPSPFTLLGGAIGAVASMLAGSAFGDKGTLIGAAAGSVITAIVSTAVEHNSKKVHERLRPELPAKPTHIDAVLYARDLVKIREAGEHRRKMRRWQLGAVFAVMLVVPMVTAFSVMSVVEASTGSTVKGFTVWHPSPAVTRTVTPPAEVVTVTPAVTPTFVSPSTVPSASVTVTPTAVPDSSPSSVSASPTVTPSPTGIASTGTPESTPTVGNPP